MEKLDCFGDFCPIPLLKAKKKAEKLKSKERFMLVTDHCCVKESIEEYFSAREYQLDVNEVINGVWEIEIIKN